MAPPAPRRFFLAYSLAGWRRSTAPSASTGRCRARGLLRQHPVRRSTATRLLAPLALRIGGSAAGADRSAETARVDQPLHTRARARPERAGPGDGPTGAAPILFSLFAGGVEAIDRTFGVHRPLSS